jgi:hypothetical protein
MIDWQLTQSFSSSTGVVLTIGLKSLEFVIA